jgi:hypothetical protein
VQSCSRAVVQSYRNAFDIIFKSALVLKKFK